MASHTTVHRSRAHARRVGREARQRPAKPSTPVRIRYPPPTACTRAQQVRRTAYARPGMTKYESPAPTNSFMDGLPRPLPRRWHSKRPRPALDLPLAPATVRLSDEQELCSFGFLDEVGGADDALDLVVEVVLVEVVHVGRHAAGPEVPARGDDLFEELGDLRDTDLGDGLLQLRGGHRGHPRQAAEPLGHVR